MHLLRSFSGVEMGGAPGSSYARNTARLRPAKWVHMPRAECMPRVRPWQKEPFMSPKLFLAVMVLLIVAGFVVLDQRDARAGEVTSNSEYKVLDPIRHGNLTVFPVVAAKSYPTGEFLTLDEGLRSGEVVVTESGSVQGLLRRHPTPGVYSGSGDVNRLVLVNNSKRPLLLLAGEVVSGGKQDRVIGKDRMVPAESDPVDLRVFCVCRGQWVASDEQV